MFIFYPDATTQLILKTSGNDDVFVPIKFGMHRSFCGGVKKEKHDRKFHSSFYPDTSSSTISDQSPPLCCCLRESPRLAQPDNVREAHHAQRLITESAKI
jgi:hypothetical protein